MLLHLTKLSRVFYAIASITLTSAAQAEQNPKLSFTPYEAQKVIFDFYFDQPEKINSALYWIRSFLNPLMDSPYDFAPEFLDIIVMIHGTEIVAVTKKNNHKYKATVDRMGYYNALGVKFKVCAIAANDFGYNDADFYDFVEIVPSAMNELVHWQMKGYGLITPRIYAKKLTNEEIR